MAITAAACQAELDPGERTAKITQSLRIGTVQEWYVVGGIGVGSRARWVQTTAADNAATQAAAILSKLQEG